ncbi:MAG: superoxide dismutase family protein, partial [Luteimonas sp.]
MRLLLPVAAMLLLSACAAAPAVRAPLPVAPPEPVEFAEAGTVREAVANLASASGSLVSGRVMLQAQSGAVQITGEVGGLIPHGA